LSFLRIFFLFLLVLFFASSKSFAGALNLYGYGAENISLGNATVSLPLDAFSQNYNPALMSLEPRSLFSFGLDGAITSFESINRVIVDTPSLGATQVTVGDVNTATPDSFLATLACQTPLSLKKKDPIHLGFYLASPVQRMLGIDTQDSFQPQYAMYLSDTQKLVAGLNTSIRFFDRFSIGLGAELYFGQGVTGILRQPAGGNSTSRLKVDVKPQIAPIIGTEFEVSRFWKLGASYHAKEDFQTNINLQDSISLLGPVPVNFTARTSYNFEPETFRAGLSFTDDKTGVAFGADWQRWAGFSGTTVILNYSTFTGTFGQTLPPTPYHDVIVLHGGVEHKFSINTLRAGYTFMPTPVPEQSGESNILDSDKHVVAVGWGHTFETELIDGLVKLDLAAFVQMLQPKQVIKNSSQSVGYPGYKIGGTIYGYSSTLTLQF
jgi:long-subunit fatty acid transport protein